VGGGDGEVERWSRDGHRLQSLDPGDGPVLALGSLGGLWHWPAEGVPALVAQLEYPITALAWDGQGSLLVGGGDGEVERWSRDGHRLQSLDPGDGPVLALGSLGGQTWVDSHGEARLLGLDGRERLRAEGGGLRLVVSPHPTAPLVLVGGPEGRAFLWAADGAEPLPLHGHSGAMRQAAWSPDGRLLLTSAYDGVPHLWDLQGRLLAELRDEEHQYWNATFTPDGQEIISSTTGHLRRWNLQGQPQEVLRTYAALNWASQLSWTPDGRHLWVWLDDAGVDLVDISPEAALEEAHRRLEATPDIEPTRGVPGLHGSLN
jgi:WD40 repeat protein